MFHAAKHFVSHCRTLCLKPLKHDSTPYAWDELCGLMFLVDHFKAYFQSWLTQLILIFITS